MAKHGPHRTSFIKSLHLAIRAFLFGVVPKKMGPPEGWAEHLLESADPNLTADRWLGHNFEDPGRPVTLEEVAQYQVRQLTHYKNNLEGSWQHEFVVANLVNVGTKQKVKELYIKFERSLEGNKEDKSEQIGTSSNVRQMKNNMQRAKSILIDNRVDRLDLVTAITVNAIKGLEDSVKNKHVFALRRMTFPGIVTILDLAAVLEAHSTLSTSYRLRATMCYWFAGSTYEVMEKLFKGLNEDLEHANKAGMFYYFKAYRRLEDKGDVVELVKDLEKSANTDKSDKETQVTENVVIMQEIEKIPSFDRLCTRSLERRDQVKGVLEKRAEVKRIREQEERDKELELARAREEQATLEYVVRQLREELKALQLIRTGGGRDGHFERAETGVQA